MQATDIEKTSSNFSVEKALRARERSWAAKAAVAAKIRPGMLEEEAYELAKAELVAGGAEKNWHRPLVRFGRNTLKKFSEPSEPGVRLGEHDVFFLDFGPVFEGHEADTGDTYATGSDPEMARCASDARKLFGIVRDEWKRGALSGAELYRFAAVQAEQLGWVLHPGVDGHRVSDFPHALYFKGGIGEVDFKPAAHVWILEIQIRHPTREFGAFFEDLLF